MLDLVLLEIFFYINSEVFLGIDVLYLFRNSFWDRKRKGKWNKKFNKYFFAKIAQNGKIYLNRNSHLLDVDSHTSNCWCSTATACSRAPQFHKWNCKCSRCIARNSRRISPKSRVYLEPFCASTSAQFASLTYPASSTGWQPTENSTKKPNKTSKTQKNCRFSLQFCALFDCIGNRLLPGLGY